MKAMGMLAIWQNRRAGEQVTAGEQTDTCVKTFTMAACSPYPLLSCSFAALEPRNRGERIRTFDLLVPNQALCQAELRPATYHYY